MLRIELEGIAKRFNDHAWLIKDFSCVFEKNQSYAITGANGSGKSTLSKIITGMMPVNKGKVNYYRNNNKIESAEVFDSLTYAAPYMELIEEMTLSQLIDFHFRFKNYREGINPNEFLNLIYMEDEINKEVKNFSSGMKQRLKLGLALFSEAEFTILDEPTANLDDRGVSWYHDQIKAVLGERIVIIASNQAHEYDFTQKRICISMDGKLELTDFYEQ